MRARLFIGKLGRAARLDADLYNEVKTDGKAGRQAFLVVVLASLAISIGIGIAGWFSMTGPWSILGILICITGSVIVWFVWSFFAYLIGTRVFRGAGTTASIGAVLRAFGFSGTPGLLGFFLFLPVVGGIILTGVSVWALAAGTVAIKHSLNLTTGRAIATCLATWFICALIIVLAVVPLSSFLIDGTCTCGSNFDSQISSILSPYRFSIVRWEIATIPHELGQLFSVGGKDIDKASEIVTDYFSNTGETDKAQRNTVEKILESQIKETLIQQDISGFPPVNLKLGDLPRLLVISPREKIESMREIMLIYDIGLEEIEDIEARVDELGVSSLVVNLGGFGGAYPSFITDNASLRATIDIAVEEWIHQYLAFKPLGFRYVLDILGIARNYEVATMNETVAGIVSEEIGAIIYEKHYSHREENATDGNNADESGFDFNQEMREIRMAVDTLLARGEIDLAEKYMEERRQYLLSQGYHIRKLNQAYFAWHGTYADEPTSVSPIGTELRQLRSNSSSIKDFLDEVIYMTGRQDLKAAIESLP